MEEPNNDIDTETLQAQIDLSMAYAQNLIASWLPTSGPMSQSSSRAAEAGAELQAILRRPPRLGVGAPIPETPASTQTRLMQKLEGGKKRTREMENGTQAPMVNNDDQREGDSAEESRAVGIAIRKRQRVDPFESGGRKKKKKVVELVSTAEAARTMDDIERKEAPQSGLMATDDAMTKLGPKKKKKKRHRLGSRQVHDAPGGPVSETRSALPDATQLAESSTQSSLLEEWDGILPDQWGSRSGTPSSSCPVPSPGVGASLPILSLRTLPSSLSTSTQTLTSVTSVASTSSSPVLNLTGATPMAPEKTEPSSSKKRRRRRKKKKSTTGQGPDDGPP